MVSRAARDTFGGEVGLEEKELVQTSQKKTDEVHGNGSFVQESRRFGNFKESDCAAEEEGTRASYR